MKTYTKEETINKLNNALKKIDNLYNQGFINWSGKTSDTKEYYSEVLSEYLLKNKFNKKISQINQIDRLNYKVKTHVDKISRNKTNRKEENFAKSLVWMTIDKIGKVIDYQVPLKKSRKDKAGKIDIITYKPGIAYIVELKYEGNEETLLRAVLEISTYYQQLNEKNFVRSFNEYKSLRPKNVKKTILVSQNSKAYEEAKELHTRPMLKKLIKKLNVQVFLLPLKAERII